MRTVRRRGQVPAPVHVLFSLTLLSAIAIPVASLGSHTFRANAGIWASDVLYLANRGSHAIYFKANEVILDVKSPSTREDGQGAQGSIVRLRFAGANPAPRVEAIEPTPVLYSYYLGAAATDWRRGVREYGGIAYRDLWPGVDLVFRDLGGRLGYAIVLHGGAAAQARWTYEGATVSGGDDNRLIQTPNGSFLENRSYTGLTGWLSFSEADDTPAAPATPEMPWSSFLGGGLAVGQVLISAGPDGSTIVAGNAGASYAPGQLGDYGEEMQVGSKIFVARFSASRQLEWVCFLGGAGTDLVRTLRVGRSNILIGGESSSADFPKTLASLGSTSGSGSRAFLARLSVVDGTLIWTRMLGFGYVQSVAVLSSGVHYAVGRTSDPNFPTTAGVFDRSPGTGLGGDGFVTSLDLSGNLRWSTLLGGSAAELISGVALDGQGRVVVAGRTNSTDFPTTAGAVDRVLNSSDTFVTCLTSDGSALAWSTLLGGSGHELVSSLAIGARGEVLVGGATESADYPVVGAQARPHAPGILSGETARDGFVTALAPDGTRILWSSCLGGGLQDEVFALEVDPQGRVVAAGTTLSSDFWLAGRSAGSSFRGASDAFVVRFASDGGGETEGVLLGGAGAEAGRSLVCLPSGATLVGGLTTSQDFPTTFDSHDSCFEGRVEIFMTEITLAPAASPLARAVPEGAEPGALSNSPNPFNPATTISWELKEGAVVQVEVFDVAGRRVRTLLSEAKLPAGRHSAVWNGDDDQGHPLASGIYLCRLRAGGQDSTKRMTLLK